MGDYSDVPPWTCRILPLNFYTKFFRPDVFYRIMTEREREKEKGSDRGGKKRRERGWKERERERKRVERRHGRQDGYISLVEIRARARMRETEREGRDGNSPDIGKAGPE